MDLPVPKAGKIDKIYHISDIHISGSLEYKYVFDEFISQINGDSAICIITGDVYHKKLLSPEDVKLFTDLISETAKKCPVYIIRGNHDYHQNLPEKLDSIMGTIGCLQELNKNIVYLNKSMIYEVGNIILGLTAIQDVLDPNSSNAANRKTITFPPVNSDKIKIALFHGMLDEFEIKNCARNYNYGLFGDNHKQQIITDGEFTYGYAGSMIQQNFGESVCGHGYLLWNLDLKTVIPIHITPLSVKVQAVFEYMWYFRNNKDEKIPVSEFLKTKYCPKKLYIQSAYNIAGLKELLTVDYEIQQIHVKTATQEIAEPKIIIDTIDGYIERFKLSLGAGEWENWLRNPDLLRIQEGPNPVINKQIEVKNAKLGIEQVKDIIITPKIINKFKITYMSWNWILCYGPDNYIDFDKMDGKVAAIMGANNCGKTSLFEIICIGLFSTQITSRKLTKIDECVCESYETGTIPDIKIYFDIGDKRYLLNTEFQKHTKDSRQKIRKLYEIKDNLHILLLNGEKLVEPWVKANIGSFNDYLTTSMITQDSEANFFTLDAVDQLNILDRMMNIQLTDALREMFKECILAYSQIRKSYEATFGNIKLNFIEIDDKKYELLCETARETANKIRKLNDINESIIINYPGDKNDLLLESLEKITLIDIEPVAELEKIRDSLVGFNHNISEIRMDRPLEEKPKKYFECEFTNIETDIKYSEEEYTKFMKEYAELEDLHIAPIHCKSAPEIIEIKNKDYLNLTDDEIEQLQIEYGEQTKLRAELLEIYSNNSIIVDFQSKLPRLMEIKDKIVLMKRQLQEKEELEKLITAIEISNIAELTYRQVEKVDELTYELANYNKCKMKDIDITKQYEKMMEISREYDMELNIPVICVPNNTYEEIKSQLAEINTIDWDRYALAVENNKKYAKLQQIKEMKTYKYNPLCAECQCRLADLNEFDAEYDNAELEIKSKIDKACHRESLESDLKTWELIVETNYFKHLEKLDILRAKLANKTDIEFRYKNHKDWETVENYIQYKQNCLIEETNQKLQQIANYKSKIPLVNVSDIEFYDKNCEILENKIYQRIMEINCLLKSLPDAEIFKIKHAKECIIEYERYKNRDLIDKQIKYLEMTKLYDVCQILNKNHNYKLSKLAAHWQEYEQYCYNKLIVVNEKIAKSIENDKLKVKQMHYDILINEIHPKQDQKRKLLAEIRELEQELTALNRKIATFDEQIRQNKKYMENGEEIQKICFDLDRKEQMFKQLVILINGFKMDIYREIIIPKIQNMANLIMKEICPESPNLVIDAETSNANAKASINLIWSMVKNGIKTNIAKNGGYMKFIAGIALRVSIRDLGILNVTTAQLFIDEGFVSADKKNLERAPEFIHSLLKNYDSVIIVSHSDIIADSADIKINIDRRQTSKIIFGDKMEHIKLTKSVEITVAPVKNATLKKTAIINKVECGFIQQSNGKPCTNAANNGNRCGKHKDN
jgi:DNA repair exonuclease SbcCD ATPase subunit